MMSGAGVSAISGEVPTPGWASTPTSEPTPTETTQAGFIPFFVTRGWQKTILYLVLVLLMVLVFLNIALTLWIIASLKLSVDSIGPIRIVNGGIQLDGHAFVTGQLIAGTLQSRPAQPITVHSYRNFSVLVSDLDHTEQTKLLIKKDSIVCEGKSFEVLDIHGKAVFKASKDEVRIAAETLTLNGEGGVSVPSAVQTSSIRAPPGNDLQLESQTRKLDLRAPQLIQLESRAGSIDIVSHGNIKIDSVVGALKIDAQNIFFNKLKEAVPIPNSPSRNKGLKPAKVYQLCVCASGKLFLAASDGHCVAANDDTELCR